MDGFSRYNQIMMLHEDREKTTFITLWGTFCYKVMPFGRKNAGATYQRAMVALFHDMIHKEIEVYVDNMIAKSKTPEQYIEDLWKLFTRLQKYKLRLNPTKCTFGQKLEWNSECQEAFEKIKSYLENPPVLVPAVPRKPLILYLIVLEESMGCMKERAGYLLPQYKIHRMRKEVTALERTCCALVWAAKRLRQYMLSHTTWLVAKTNPIKYILEKPALTGKITRWQMALSEYDIIYVNQKAVKGSALVEHLAYHPLEDFQPLAHEFPDEHIATTTSIDPLVEEWSMWFDGVVLASPKNQYFPFATKLGFDCTNNMAEYEAWTMGLLIALEFQVKKRVFGDSALVIYQLRGESETRDAKLIPYHDHVREIVKAFDVVTFHHIPREENQMADALATLSVMVRVNDGQEMTVHVQQQSREAYCQQPGLEIAEIDVDPWYFDIKQYLEKGEYLEGASENGKRTLRRLASGFLLSGAILYKRNADMTHDSPSNNGRSPPRVLRYTRKWTYPGPQNLASRILWTKMEADCYQYVKKCLKCQTYADHINAASSTPHSLSSPWPFAMWGIDVIRPIEPKASNGHRFILVAIDYFTKWVEAASYSTVTRSVVTKFIKKDIICRYWLPAHIMIDNDTNLNNKMMTELCEQFRIHHYNSTPYRPKMNGAVEAANKNLKKIIQKMVVTYKDWHEMLPYALHGYRTSVRTSTGATPYSLVYGTEAVLPVEVEIPSLRVLAEKRVKNAFDKKVKPRVFTKGDMVLKKVLPNTKDLRGKWAPKYEGPYVVKHAFCGGALTLTDAEGRNLRHLVNADSVKIFFP
ncbi:Retrovirus-related Pol polyprotein, partial [Mucuna pruriens]